MIVLLTNYDDATASNYAVCSILLGPGHPHLFIQDAVRLEVLATLDQHPNLDLMFAGHGGAGALTGSDGQPAVSSADAHLLGQRRTFALACRTAEQLGPTVSASGGTWCGFEGPINCLPSDEDIIEQFQRIPEFVSVHLASVDTEDNAKQFLADFEELLDDIEDRLDFIAPSSMEPYLTTIHLRERLRIWTPGVAHAAMSNRATFPAALF